MQLIENDGEGDWKEINEAGPKVQAVTSADVLRVANTYFTKENRTVAVYTRSWKRAAATQTRRGETMKYFRSHFSLKLAAATALSSSVLSCLVLAQEQPSKDSAGVTSIPDRPEKLSFPTLAYEPPAPEKYRVQLKSGPVAYVVPDRELPLVNLVVYVRTGQYVEPDAKQGLAELTGYLLARGGTKSKTAEELEERLAFLAANLNSGVGENQGSLSLNLLSKDLPEGLSILREVLTAPRFQDDKIALRKQQMLQNMKERNDNSSSIERREAEFLAYGENFWANRYSTAASVESLTRSDLEGFHRQWFQPPNFVVAVSGDFDRDQMIAKLEESFGNWPFTGARPPSIPTNTVFAPPGVYVVDKDVNQGRVAMMLPGILRDSPDYFPVLIMNDILGGGGFHLPDHEPGAFGRRPGL